MKPKVSHTGYILDTLKETFTCNEHATDMWLLVGSRVVEEITSRGGETRSDINAPLNPHTSESLEHREQYDALDVSSSVEITHNETDADGITIEKPPSQELVRRQPSSDITTEENSSDEEYIPETIPIEKSPANSSSLDPAHHIYQSNKLQHGPRSIHLLVIHYQYGMSR